METNYKKSGNGRKSRERILTAATPTFEYYKRQWLDHIDQLESLRHSANIEEIKQLDGAIEKLKELVNTKRRKLIEEGDTVTVNIDLLEQDCDSDIVSADFYLHVMREIAESIDGTLTVHRINSNECHCFSTGKDSERYGLLGPILEGEYLMLYKKKDEEMPA